MTTRLRLLLTSLTLAAGVAGGCGSSSDDESGSSTAASTTAKAASGGTLELATITGVLPYESLDKDGKTVIGFEPDLMRAGATEIGMTPKFTITEFDSLLPGIDSGRFDVVFAGMIDKAEREKAYDGVQMLNDKYSWAAKSDLAAKTKSFDDMCGHKVGLLAGSAYLTVTEEAAKKCEAGGKGKMKLLTFNEDSQGYLALKSGQIDYYPGNLPLIVQFGKDNPGFAGVGFTMLPGPSAIWLKKGGPLTAKVQKGLQAIMDDGTYAKILAKWGVSDIGIEKALVNPVTTGQVKPVS